MLEILHCLRNRSDIIKLQALSSKLFAVATKLHGVKIFDYQSCETLTTITDENLNSQTRSIAFSPNAEFMTFCNNTHIFIFHLSSKIIIKTIKTDGETIEQLEFDSESKYIIAATLSGRVLQYRYDGSSLLARLYSFPQISNIPTKVTSFAFLKGLMVCGTNKGNIFSINLNSRANKVLLLHDNAQINSLCFIDATTIVSGDSKGNLYLSSLKNERLIKKIETGFTKIVKILLMPNTNYLMILGNDKNVSVYDIHSFKLLHNKYIEFNAYPTDMFIADEHTLVTSLASNSIEKVLLPNADKLRTFIVSNELDKAYRLIENDPLLKGTKEYKMLEIAYQNTYKQALEALSQQNKEKAIELTKMFKYIDVKADEIKLLFKSFENYSRFRVLYAEKKYALAYAMCNKFPPLMNTFQYTRMESIWEETFKNAQRQIAFSKPENAVTLLNEYATVTQKRPIIKLILNHNSDFSDFLKAIETKDFRKIDTLATNNSLFTLVPTYKDVQTDMKHSLESIESDILNCDIKSAVHKLTKLHNINSVSETVSLHKEECKAVKKLQDAYKENNFLKCYEIIDKYHILNATDLGILLQTHWSKLISQSEAFALKGNFKEIKTGLGELIHLKTRRDKIGDLFRLSFHTRIKGLMANKTYKQAETIIYSYIDIFGIDREIISLMSSYERKANVKLAITQNSRCNRDKWIESDIIMKA